MLSSWCDHVIRWGFYLLFALVPLLLTPWNYELFEYNKMMGVYALTIIIIGAWLVKSMRQGEFRITRTPLDIPIGLFVASQLVSSIFSMDPHVSWFGYYSRFNGGMFSIISYVLLFYAFVSNISNGTNMLKVALGSGVVVALYGLAERLGIDKHLWVQDVQNRVFSTMGQPNWLAAFLVALIPIASGFALKSQISNHNVQQGKKSFYWSLEFVIWILTAALFFAVLLFTRSRSGLLGFVIADVLFWGLVFLKTKRIGLPFVLTHLAFVILFVFFGPALPIPSLSRSPAVEATPSASYSAPLLEVGGTESGTIRKYVWQGALSAWRSSTKNLMIGTGTETFAFAFYQFKPKGHNLTSEWDFLYNKAHNEYLNYLATTGIFGLGSYLIFIGAFIVWFFKFSKKELLHVALFAGWISILVTNFFGFSVVILQVFFFLFPAMLIASTHRFTITLRFPRFMIWIVALLVIVLVMLVGIAWYADTLFASGYRLSRAGQYGMGASFLKRAVHFNPIEPSYFDELGSAYAGMVTDAVDGKDATTAATLVRLSLESSDRALSISPKNVNFWKTRTKIYYAFSDIDPAFTPAAITALEKARELSPTDPKIIYNLAILEGHKGMNEKAIELLRQAIDFKPNYRDAYYALWVFYGEVKKHDLARNTLEEYIAKVDPGDKDFLERLNK